MILDYNDYEGFVKKVTRSVPLLKTEQLMLMIAKFFNQDFETVEPILFALQRNQVILMTRDGWSMTVGQYIKISGDRFLVARSSFDSRSDEFNRLPNMDDKCRKINRPLSKALWIVADMMPDSADFIIASSPWTVAYATIPTENIASRLYEVAYIDKGYEVTGTELLKRVPKIQSNTVKNSIVRICIIEDEDYAFRVPHIGFAYIVKIDHDTPNHYRIVEDRTLEANIPKEIRWEDDPFHD